MTDPSPTPVEIDALVVFLEHAEREIAEHGGFDNHARTISEAASRLVSLQGELAAMKKERDAMNDDTYPEGVTATMHIAHDIKMGRFPEQSSIATFLAERDAERRNWTPNEQFTARIRELSTPPKDDYDRAVHLLLEAYELRLQDDRAAKVRASQAEAPDQPRPQGKAPSDWYQWLRGFEDETKSIPRDNLPRIARAIAGVGLGFPLSTDQPRGVRVTDDLAYLLGCVETHADKFPVPSHMRSLVARVRAALQEAPAPATFKPCVIVNEEAGITEAVFEDVPYIAEPVFEGAYHWMDKHVAMDDGRLVGFAVWKTAPATEQRETVTDAQVDAAMLSLFGAYNNKRNYHAWVPPRWNEARIKVRAALEAASVSEANPAADQIIGQIEDRFPNWRSYRDLIDCIDCTLHDLRGGKP